MIVYSLYRAFIIEKIKQKTLHDAPYSKFYYKLYRYCNSNVYDSFAQCQNLKICKFQRVRRVHNMICNSNWNNFTSYSSYFKWSNSFFKAKITFFRFYQKSFEMFYVTKNVKTYFLIFKKWLSYGRLDCNVLHYYF